MPSSGSSRVWRSLPFCAEKRPYFLSEIEEFFVALLVKQSFSSSRKYDGYRGVVQFCVATQLATPLGTKNIHTMNTDTKNGSDFDPDNIIAVTLDELSDDDRREVERVLEEEKAEKMKLMLAGFQKTRNGIVKKVATPSPSDLLGAKVKNPTDEIANLIDASVASKFGIMFDKFEELKDQLSKDLKINLPRHGQSSLGLQTEKLMPMEYNRLFDMPHSMHIPGPSANVIQPYVALDNSQSGRNYANSLANNFVSGLASPTVTTSASQNYSNNN